MPKKTIIELENEVAVFFKLPTEELFSIRIDAGISLLESTYCDENTKQVMMRSETFWNWFRRIWLNIDQSLIRHSTSYDFGIVVSDKVVKNNTLYVKVVPWEEVLTFYMEMHDQLPDLKPNDVVVECAFKEDNNKITINK